MFLIVSALFAIKLGWDSGPSPRPAAAPARSRPPPAPPSVIPPVQSAAAARARQQRLESGSEGILPRRRLISEGQHCHRQPDARPATPVAPAPAAPQAESPAIGKRVSDWAAAWQGTRPSTPTSGTTPLTSQPAGKLTHADWLAQRRQRLSRRARSASRSSTCRSGRAATPPAPASSRPIAPRPRPHRQENPRARPPRWAMAHPAGIHQRLRSVRQRFD